MATKRQHFLPRLLQRNFASRVSKDNYFCWVYPKSGDPYETNIINIAVESYFYSQPDESDLENQISKFEGRMSQVLEELCVVKQDTNLDAEKVAELVAHSVVRTRHVRETFQNTGQSFMTMLENMLDSPADLKDMLLHYIRENPEEFRQSLRDEIKNKSGPSVDSAIVEQMIDALLPHAGQLIDQNLDQSHAQLQSMLGTVKEKMPDHARTGHIGGLNKELAPEPRVKRVMEFSWRVTYWPDGGLILGDLGPWGIGNDPKACFSLLWGRDDLSTIYFPISSAHLLTGTKETYQKPETIDPINRSSAELSDKHFIAGERTDKLIAYQDLIGSNSTVIIDEQLKEMEPGLRKDILGRP